LSHLFPSWCLLHRRFHNLLPIALPPHVLHQSPTRPEALLLYRPLYTWPF
jgi:hypothetical protein